MSNQPTLITVFSDASFRDGCVGHGYWIKSKHKETTNKGFALADSVNSAELTGCLRALEIAVHLHSHIEGEKAYIVQCDSLAALGALITRGVGIAAKTSPIPIPARNSLTQQEDERITEFLSAHPNLTIWLKHVKGHTAGRDGRSGVNRTVDRLARQARMEGSQA